MELETRDAAGGVGRTARVPGRLFADRPLDLRELAGVAALLLAVLVAFGLHHVLHGGFIEDEWTQRSTWVFAPGHDLLSRMEAVWGSSQFVSRPLYGFYVAITQAVFGRHEHEYLAFALVLAGVFGVSVHGLLRVVGLRPWQAFTCALLVVLLPAADSLRLWAGTSGAQGGVAVVLAGLSVSIVAWRRSGRRALLLHALGVSLYVIGIMWYEVTLPLIFCAVLLYRLVVPWRLAVRRWLIDWVILLPFILFVTLDKPGFGHQSLGGMLDHLRLIALGARNIFFSSILSFGSTTWFCAVPLLLVLGAGLAAAIWEPLDDARRGELRRWLCIAAVGLLVAALGYAMYVPTLDYYEPDALGIVNRVNIVSGIGWVLLVFASLMVLALVSFRGERRGRVIPGLVLAGCAALVISWIHPLTHDARRYDVARMEQANTLHAIRTALPRPPHHSAIYEFGQPIEVYPGVAVFGNDFDTSAAIKLVYHDPTLVAAPAFSDLGFICGAKGLTPTGHELRGGYARPYGRVFFVDTLRAVAVPIPGLAACRKIVREFGRSPDYPANPV